MRHAATFEDWLRTACFQSPPKHCEDLARAAWNAAIDAADAAIEAADHNDDASGHSANCNAMIAVEKLKTGLGR